MHNFDHYPSQKGDAYYTHELVSTSMFLVVPETPQITVKVDLQHLHSCCSFLCQTACRDQATAATEAHLTFYMY